MKYNFLLGWARVITAELACALWRMSDENEHRPDSRLVYDLANQVHLIAHYGSIIPVLRRYFNENKAV